MDYDIMILTKDIAIMLGKKVQNLTRYRAELIHLKNEHYTDEQIVKMINENTNSQLKRSTVTKWLNNGTQPSDEVIIFLEKLFDLRLKRIYQNTINPTRD